MKKYLLLISTAILASCSQGNRDWEPDRSNSCQIIISGDPTIFECAVAVPYRITNEAASKMSDHGLCWNTSGNPTLDDNSLRAPICLKTEMTSGNISPEPISTTVKLIIFVLI